MNKSIVVVFAVACASVSNAQLIVTNAPKFSASYRETGGFVIKPDPSNGRVLIVNAQKIVDSSVFTNTVRYMHFHAKMSIATQEVKPGFKPSISALKDLKANVAVVVSDNPSESSPIVLSPDEHWAIVNVAALNRDNPGMEVLETRVRKAVSRTICFVCGSGGSQYPNTLVGPFKDSVKDYERFESEGLPPDVFPRMRHYLNTIGVKPITRVTYEEACQQGWAEEPKDEVQREIWNRVHSLPTNPIQIEFDPKNDK